MNNDTLGAEVNGASGHFRRVRGSSGAQRVRCEECLTESDEAARGWIALLAEDVDGREPISVAVFCPACAHMEFGFPVEGAAGGD
jgi:hypothetical protein